MTGAYARHETLLHNPNTFAGLVGKVRKNYLPKEGGREGGEKTRAARPPGPGLEPGTCPVPGEGPGPSCTPGDCLDKQAFPCL